MAPALHRPAPPAQRPPPAAARENEILKFWFGNSPETQALRTEWFKKDPAFDAAVAETFAADYEQAKAGDYDHWQDTPRACLALVLLLDQFPRNLFRDDARAFATDAKALNVAQHALAKGFDAAVTPVERLFFYLPFEHSEDPLMQDRGVALLRALPGWELPGSPYHFAQRHWDIIRRFGRFPHRNAALGRESTPAEREFLKQPDSGF